MRSAVIGATFADQPDKIDEYVAASTQLTHRDPRALAAARAVAHLAAWVVRDDLDAAPSADAFVMLLRSASADDEWRAKVDAVATACQDTAPVAELANRLGLERGVTGYAYHTVPVAAYAWFHHFGDFEATLTSVLDCGGDTDTVGAIAGALAGAVVGERGIPQDWIAGIKDWPRGVPLLRRLADELAGAAKGSPEVGPVPYFWPGVLPRNLAFLAVVLFHGLRRLLPPY